MDNEQDEWNVGEYDTPMHAIQTRLNDLTTYKIVEDVYAQADELRKKGLEKDAESLIEEQTSIYILQKESNRMAYTIWNTYKINLQTTPWIIEDLVKAYFEQDIETLHELEYEMTLVIKELLESGLSLQQIEEQKHANVSAKQNFFWAPNTTEHTVNGWLQTRIYNWMRLEFNSMEEAINQACNAFKWVQATHPLYIWGHDDFSELYLIQHLEHYVINPSSINYFKCEVCQFNNDIQSVLETEEDFTNFVKEEEVW